MENIILEIIDLDDKGRGVAKKDGLVYFVDQAKLGQIVAVEIVKEKKSFCEAIIKELVEESPYLTSDNVGEENLCGVYELYDISYDKQIEFKKDKLINQINRIAGENLEDIKFVEADKKQGYRNKLEIKVNPNGDLSYFSRSTNDHVKINQCLMNTKEINDIVLLLKDLLKRHDIKGYDPRTNKGLVKNIIIRSTSLGQTMLILVYNEDFDFSKLAKDLEASEKINSFYISKNTKSRNYKMQDLQHVFGAEKIQEQLGDKTFNISAKAFMQVNKNVSYDIYMQAKEYLKNIKPQILLDLYSGISTTSILFADKVEKIMSVEINKDAVQDAKENAAINKVDNIEFINKPAEKAIEDLKLNQDNTTVLFDPPRRGLDESIISKIGDSNIENIIYISCNPASLARDIKRFKKYGYKLIDIIAYDQFVNTLEIETLVRMKRKVKRWIIK